MNYNTSFFGLFENIFKLLQKEYGNEKALCHFTSLMETGLSKSYGTEYQKGNPMEFERLVGARDKLVGLEVKFEIISDDQLIYQFHVDPFPNLKGHLAYQDLDKTYMDFKVKYILGENWHYKTVKHLWNGDKYTEHQISKNNT